MALFLSLSNNLCKILAQPFERVCDAQGERLGVLSINTNAHRISWQAQLIHLSGPQWQPYDDGSWLVVYMESHSRYCMLTHYPLKPSWPQLQQDFYQSWKLHAIGWLRANQFIQNDEQGMQVLDNIEAYFAETKVNCFRNLDPSIGAHIAEVQQYLHSLFDIEQPELFDNDEAWELSHYINQQPKKIAGQRAKKYEFIPVERFINDALYRFGSGICDQSIANVQQGDFPCPYSVSPILKAVK